MAVAVAVAAAAAAAVVVVVPMAAAGQQMAYVMAVAVLALVVVAGVMRDINRKKKHAGNAECCRRAASTSAGTLAGDGYRENVTVGIISLNDAVLQGRSWMAEGRRAGLVRML